MNIKQLQDEVNARWDKQLANPCHRSADSAHALIHLTKALGKVASALNEAQHGSMQIDGSDVGKYLADLVICASRFARPAGVDLDAACQARLAEKFPVAR